MLTTSEKEVAELQALAKKLRERFSVGLLGIAQTFYSAAWSDDALDRARGCEDGLGLE